MRMRFEVKVQVSKHHVITETADTGFLQHDCAMLLLSAEILE